mmetsp:Transcript_49698/g.129555  ORF Transcript_49698/g.129555 Transcript_49698/m.129555 type:complete len:486 (+) Transcript_49698:3-1460(+)
MPDSMPWIGDAPPAPSQSAASAVILEIARSKGLQELRQCLRSSCANASKLHAPLHAIERWLLMSKWEEALAETNGRPVADALFAASGSTPIADAGLASDLERAGLSQHQVAGIVLRVQEKSVALAERMAKLARRLASAGEPAPSPVVCEEVLEEQGGAMVQLHVVSPPAKQGGGASQEDQGEVVSEQDSGMTVLVTSSCFEKLRTLYFRQHATLYLQQDGQRSDWDTTAREDSFRARAFCCLLRYHSLGGAGFQAGLGANVFRELQGSLGCNFELFASPLNCFYGPHCSAFADVDAPFGSRGSCATFAPRTGSYEVNPPFVPAIMDAMADRLLALLVEAQAARHCLSFVVVLPGWTDNAGYRALSEAAPFLRASLLLAAVDHGFVDGAAHRRQRSHRQSPYDTRLFVLQTDAAAAQWPADSEVLTRLERTLAACTPSEDDLKVVPTSERVHRSGAARSQGRRKMKRAGKKTKAWQASKHRPKGAR